MSAEARTQLFRNGNFGAVVYPPNPKILRIMGLAGFTRKALILQAVISKIFIRQELRGSNGVNCHISQVEDVTKAIGTSRKISKSSLAAGVAMSDPASGKDTPTTLAVFSRRDGGARRFRGSKKL